MLFLCILCFSSVFILLVVSFRFAVSRMLVKNVRGIGIKLNRVTDCSNKVRLKNLVTCGTLGFRTHYRTFFMRLHSVRELNEFALYVTNLSRTCDRTHVHFISCQRNSMTLRYMRFSSPLCWTICVFIRQRFLNFQFSSVRFSLTTATQTDATHKMGPVR